MKTPKESIQMTIGKTNITGRFNKNGFASVVLFFINQPGHVMHGFRMQRRWIQCCKVVYYAAINQNNTSGPFTYID